MGVEPEFVRADSLGSTVERPLDQRSTRSTDPDDWRAPSRSHGHHRVVHVGVANGTCHGCQLDWTAGCVLYEHGGLENGGKQQAERDAWSSSTQAGGTRCLELVCRLLGKTEDPRREEGLVHSDSDSITTTHHARNPQ